MAPAVNVAYPGDLDPSHHARLGARTAARFTGDTLFDRVARAVCRAECLPRKELYESWEMARRVRRHFRGGRVVDLAAGHGLLAQLLCLLDASSPAAIACDVVRPPCADKVAAALREDWPRLSLEYAVGSLDALPFGLGAEDLIVSAHACGTLTDRVLELAIAARARVAVLPCCHDFARCDDGGLAGWVDAALAIDLARASRLAREGYEVRTMRIPESVTPKNRLLLGAPRGA